MDFVLHGGAEVFRSPSDLRMFFFLRLREIGVVFGPKTKSAIPRLVAISQEAEAEHRRMLPEPGELSYSTFSWCGTARFISSNHSNC